MLSVLVHAHSIRWLAPAVVMLGASPAFFSMWGLIRLLTGVLPHRFYRNADDTLYAVYQRFVLFFFFSVNDIKVYVYGNTAEVFSKKENVIYICNHQSTVDWMIANLLGLKQGSLPQVRYVMKDGLKYFPLYGCYLKQHGCIFVKRSGKFSQMQMEKQVSALKTRKDPVWMVIFPEGTRFNPDLSGQLEKSHQYAAEQGFEELDFVLSPKIKAFQVCVEQLGEYVDAVYDVTIGYSHSVNSTTGERITAPGMPDFLLRKSPELHLNIERISMSDIPTDEKSMQKWMFAQFAKKDKLLSHFYSDKQANFKYPRKGDLIQVSLADTLPSTLFWIACLTAIFSHPQGRSLFWKVSLISTLGGCVWMGFRSQA